MDAWPESNTPVKVLYDDGGGTRAIRGRFSGETDDGMFIVLVRPLGDQVLVAKSRVMAVSTISEEAWGTGRRP